MFDLGPSSTFFVIQEFSVWSFLMWIIWESNMMNPSQSCLKRNIRIWSGCSTIWILILHMTSRKIVMRKNKRWVIRQSVLYRQVCINDQTTPFCAKCHSFFFFILVSYICVFRSCCITFFSSSSSILTALHITSMRFSFLSLILKHLLTIIQSYTRSTASSWMFARQALAVSQIEQWSLFVSSDRNVLLKYTKFVFVFPYTYSKRDLQSSGAVDSHHDNWEFIVLHSLIDTVTDDYHVRNLVRSDSIVSIFLESVLLVNCHSYFSNRYHPKLAVYVCRFPCAQWSQRRGNSVPAFFTFSYVLHEDSFISSVVFFFICSCQEGNPRSFSASERERFRSSESVSSLILKRSIVDLQIVTSPRQRQWCRVGSLTARTTAYKS